MNCREAIKNGVQQLTQIGLDQHDATREAELLLLYSLHWNKTEMLTRLNQEINNQILTIYSSTIQERIKGKPLEYITHTANFFGYDFFVNESVLIPRIDSEVIVENAINFTKKNKETFLSGNVIKILDACCGSGCLGLSFIKRLIDDNLLNKKSKVELTLIDASSMAIQVAKINTQKINLDGCVLVKYFISDILVNGFGDDIYDIILCNPPYIETENIQTLDDSVKNFEPHIALDGGQDGLKFYKAIAPLLNNCLSSHGVAIFEIGFNQGVSAKQIFTDYGYNASLIKDHHKKDRCLIIQRYEQKP